MDKTKPTRSTVAVRCFCGNAMTVNPRARKAIVCEKCQQPLPLKAIKMALDDRARREAFTSQPLARKVTASV